jgi:type I pantothenate kinase
MLGAPRGARLRVVEPPRSAVPDDPQLVTLAAELADAARRAPGPYVVGIVGAVAVGKSTTAQRLAALLDGAPHGLSAAVVSTDSFLLANEQLEPLGGAMVKGRPQSYDWAALDRFLADVHAGAPVLQVPQYSHEVFDVLPGVVLELAAPEVLVVEGLNLLQQPPVAPFDLTGHLHHSIYLDAPHEVVAGWFIDRFLDATRAEPLPADSFYALFAGMDDAEVAAIARWTWDEINAPNLREHIESTRLRADTVVHKAADHSIERVEHRDDREELR